MTDPAILAGLFDNVYQAQPLEQSYHPAYFESASTDAAVLFNLTTGEPPETESYSREDLMVPETHIDIARWSPSFHLLRAILDDGVRLDLLKWREFEELIADLLDRDG